MVRVKYIVICNTKELKAVKVYFQEFLYERLLEFGIQEYIIENTPSYILLRFIYRTQSYDKNIFYIRTAILNFKIFLY